METSIKCRSSGFHSLRSLPDCCLGTITALDNTEKAMICTLSNNYRKGPVMSEQIPRENTMCWANPDQDSSGHFHSESSNFMKSFMKEILFEMIWCLDESVLIGSTSEEWRARNSCQENLESKLAQVGHADPIWVWVMYNKRRIYRVY